MAQESLEGRVERWLTHETRPFKKAEGEGDIFRFIIRNTGSFGNTLVVFEPSRQPGVLVIGSRCHLSHSQNARYLNMTQKERADFERKVARHCASIRAVHRFAEETGRHSVGVYVVLDSEDKMNQNDFGAAIREAIEMGDQTSRYLLKTF